ncbi:butyrate kinase [Alkalibacterium subtropicum]|uniref:Probable butyrate kinase n=1 Tax=Alkalibacterium subtropicum TaxID=753702 RepID=A0A1I1I9D5_9LACT|nr:butyrate kinase [Alkalibacterium subtropicum]SFC32836.1 butyrate kinase [Alkalibacterium subtropicum]
MKKLILVINPGSTSMKVALYNEKDVVATDTIRHTNEELAQFERIIDQKEFRNKLILGFMESEGVQPEDLVAVVGRGGLLKPIPGGTYLVEEEMLQDLREEKYNTHASNLGAILANEIAELAGISAYIVDPVVVDELDEVARVSGLKGIERRSVVHALNQKAVARKILRQKDKMYESSNVIVAHLGGGASIGAHQNGKMIDVVNGLDGEGPFTPERTGSLPLYDFAKMILDEELDLDQIKKRLAGQGGMKSYLNEIDIRNVLEMINSGNQEAELILQAMTYQVAKAIGEMATVLKGNVDFIILTGGATYGELIVKHIKERVSWIAPVEVMPGEMEMDALHEGVMRVLNKEEEPKRYSEINERGNEGIRWR